MATRGAGRAVLAVLILGVLLIGLHPVADHFVEEAAAMCTVIILAGLIVVPLAGGTSSHPREPRTQRRWPRLTAFVDQGGNDFWGVALAEDQNGDRIVLASDRDYGLYIFRYTGP